MISSKNTVLRIIAGKCDEPFSATVRAEANIKSCAWQVLDKTGLAVASGKELASAKELSFKGAFSALAWSVEEPNLYTINVKLEYENGESEELSDRFGFRYMSTEGNNFYLNGYPFYMRAYIRGCAAHEHENNCNLDEYDFYKKNILMAKSYGYNTIRFHSVIPPEACFRAAYEGGVDTFILEVEYYPCDYKEYIRKSVENINGFLARI